MCLDLKNEETDSKFWQERCKSSLKSINILMSLYKEKEQELETLKTELSLLRNTQVSQQSQTFTHLKIHRS